MRFLAPARGAIDAAVFARPPLSEWGEYDTWLRGERWPDVEELNARRPSEMDARFIAQTRELESENLHYELRIAQRGEISTREGNWHDLLNAMIWLRYPELKYALNQRQVAEIGVAGPKSRTRAQCALTHFDEAGVIVGIRNPQLLDLWDSHDWHSLFWRERDSWRNGEIRITVVGHALLEHALKPKQLIVGKAIAVLDGSNDATIERTVGCVARGVRDQTLLLDPQELRPLPLSGIPGWHQANESEAFYGTAGLLPSIAGWSPISSSGPSGLNRNIRFRFAECAAAHVRLFDGARGQEQRALRYFRSRHFSNSRAARDQQASSIYLIGW